MECPKCGATAQTLKKCQYCRFDLDAWYLAIRLDEYEKTIPIAQRFEFPLDVTTTHLQHQTGRKARFLIVFIFTIFCFLAYLFGMHHYSRGQQVDALTAQLASGQPTQVLAAVTSDDAKLVLDNRTVKPLVAYLKAHPAYVTNLKTQLMQANVSEDQQFSLKQQGTYLGVFPKYHLIIKPLYPDIQSHPAAEVTINEDSLQHSRNKPLTLGIYQVDFTGISAVKRHQTMTLTDDRHHINLTEGVAIL